MDEPRQSPARTAPSGRERQRARTRRALLEAARALAQDGRPPSISDAADAAGVSVPTAYRYFSSPTALWEEATFEATFGGWDPAAVAGAGDDVRARLDHVVTGLGWAMFDDEVAFRLRALAALQNWFHQAGRGEPGVAPVREGRRRAWNEEIVAPLRGRVADEDLRDLLGALALVWGPEALVSLRDAARLDTEDARRVMLRAARWMLDGALAELRPADGGS